MEKLGLDAMIEKIDVLEKEIKKKYPKQAGRVKIANAKALTDYEISEEHEMEWLLHYIGSLRNQL
jgi:hypothetical protein